MAGGKELHFGKGGSCAYCKYENVLHYGCPEGTEIRIEQEALLRQNSTKKLEENESERISLETMHTSASVLIEA